MATSQILIDTHERLHAAGRGSALIGSIFHKRNLTRYRYHAHQIGSKNKRAIQHCQEHRFLTLKVLVYAVCHDLYFLQNLSFRNGSLKGFVLDFNYTHSLENNILCKITKKIRNFVLSSGFF